ncbi:MAG: NlpC/P60 family protein [Pseudomonadota bacterium]
MTAPLDPRRHAHRPDLADRLLEGRVSAERFVEGWRSLIVAPKAEIHAAPSLESPRTSEFLRSEPVRVFEEIDVDGTPWMWVQSERDGYVGYALRHQIAERGVATKQATADLARVRVPHTHLYAEPSIKAAIEDESFLSVLEPLSETERSENGFRLLSGGLWIWERHITDAEWKASDWVAVAELYLHVPYVWGGKTSQGLDCSGLVQLALQMAGYDCPRDSDMMEAEVGRPIDPEGPLRRGDLVFWKGHVGVMTDAETLLHANAYHLAVAAEPLADARARIKVNSFGPVTAVKRL